MERKGRYRLTRRLGQGGMAEVFEGLAESEAGFKRRVAIKRMLPALSADASCRRMFLDEARIAAHLHHANVVAVLDYGTLDGLPFQVLEFVDGTDLEQLLLRVEQAGARLPVGLALHIATQIAYALEHVHAARDEQGQPLGIVHRDVSPSNVLVSWAGHVKLADFGIALAHDRLERTSAGGIKGKLAYMAPEQAVRGTVEGRSDVFALGCMLHRLITGETPLADIGLLAQVAGGAELELDPNLDADLAAVIRKATRSAQSERHSAGELARALGALAPRYLQEEPTGALQRFLTASRDPRERAPKRGALDALLDVELVLAEPAGRTFTARAAGSPGDSASAPEPAAEGVEERAGALAAWSAMPVRDDRTQDADSALARPARAMRRYALLGAVAGLVVLGGLAAWMGGGENRTAARAGIAQHRDEFLGASASEEQNPTPRQNPTPQQNPTLQPDPTSEQNPSPSARQNRSTNPSSKAHSSARPKANARSSERAGVVTAQDEAVSGRGTLVIGGVGANRAEIQVDGRSVGFAPKRVELSAGEHVIVLVRPDGSRLGPRLVPITTAHTPSAPARWMVTE